MNQQEPDLFKDVLKAERLKRRWAQQYVAEQVSVDTNTVSRWERGVSFPSLSLQPALCELFGMTPREMRLLNGSATVVDVLKMPVTPLPETANPPTPIPASNAELLDANNADGIFSQQFDPSDPDSGDPFERERLVEQMRGHQSAYEELQEKLKQQDISRDAAAWVEHGRHSDRLYRGSQLAEARAWARRAVPSEQVQQFLRTSTRRRARARLFNVLATLLIILALLPTVARLVGTRTFLSNTVLPGGWWILPLANQHVSDSVLFEAYAYPAVPTEPAIAYVEFTMRFDQPGTAWFVACHITQHSSDNLYTCTVNLRKRRAPSGPILISFNVFDVEDNVHDAPNGVHRIYYDPASAETRNSTFITPGCCANLNASSASSSA